IRCEFGSFRVILTNFSPTDNRYGDQRNRLRRYLFFNVLSDSGKIRLLFLSSGRSLPEQWTAQKKWQQSTQGRSNSLCMTNLVAPRNDGRSVAHCQRYAVSSLFVPPCQ